MNLTGLPQINLQPGQSGEEVKKLQSWLIQNGFNIPAGPTGNYGPETKAAVTQLQQKLGVQTNPGTAGYFGPLTIGAVTKVSSQKSSPYNPTQNSTPYTPAQNSTPYIPATPYIPQPTNQPTVQNTNTSTNNSTQTSTSAGTSGTSSGTPTPTPSSTPSPFTYDSSWSSYGITQDMWNSMSPTQQGVISLAMSSARSLYSANASNVTLQSALAAASKDPTIIAKYADAAKIDAQSFQQNLQQIQTAQNIQGSQQQQQFEAERKALAEQQASAGTAYSGFRGKAQENLATSEQGIVQSSRSALQKSLNDATTAFEAKYGTAATQPASAEFANPLAMSGISISGQSQSPTSGSENISGTLAGGVTGSEVTSKNQDINNLAGQYVSLGQIPTTTPITF